MDTLRVQAAVLGLCAAVAAAGLTSAQAQEPYYKGKRLTVLINFAVGGPADIESRIFARYLGRHIDGQPNVIIQNMDGAGGLIGSQYLGEIAQKDSHIAIAGVAVLIMFLVVMNNNGNKRARQQKKSCRVVSPYCRRQQPATKKKEEEGAARVRRRGGGGRCMVGGRKKNGGLCCNIHINDINIVGNGGGVAKMAVMALLFLLLTVLLAMIKKKKYAGR